MRLVSAADFERLDTAFRRVINAPPHERAEALDESCGDDADLRSEVERLLAIDTALPGFARDDRIDDALARRAASLLSHASTHPHPVRIGQYDIVGVLGSGGMGAVYRARQAHPRREVALKLMRHGAMAPKLMRRFEFEADVLARLQHPGVAQIYEAGTWDDGGGARPYFVMELVEGEALTTFANQAGLDHRQKLALFVQVCRAVEHAHQKGVVHRDLKPENILVAARPDLAGGDGPSVKVLDFGIARATDADVQATMSTAAGDLLGTLPYMSPEQVTGSANDVDTRCDVYALGVVLFELLAGALPLDVHGKSIPEAARAIAQDDPRPLRSADARFTGDLDTIVAKAMAKSRDERYASAGALADDIERHLRDEPISARRPTALEQWRRFARRNRALAASLLLALMSLAAATGFSTWMAWREHRANVQAQTNATAASKQADRAERVKDLMIGMFAPVYPGRPDGKVTVQDMLGQATERVREELADQPDIADEMYFVLGTIYQNLDLPQFATPVLEELLARQKAHGVEPREYVKTLELLADVFNRDRNRARAIECQREVLEIHRSFGPATSKEAISALIGLAHIVTFHGDPDEGLHLAQEALALLDSIPDERPNQRFGVQLGIGTAILLQGGRSADAEIVFREILADPRRANAYWPRHYLAQTLVKQDKVTEALSILEPMVADARANADAEPRRLGMLLVVYSEALEAARRFEQAEAVARESIAVFTRIDSAKLPTGLSQLASALHAQGRNDEAMEVINQSLEALRNDRRDTHEAAQIHRLNARILADMGKVDVARHAAGRALTIVRGMTSPSQTSVARALLAMADVEIRAGQPDDAAQLLQAALDALDDVEGPAHIERMRVEDQLARALLDAGWNSQAAAHLQHVLAARIEALGVDDPRTKAAAWLLNGLAPGSVSQTAGP